MTGSYDTCFPCLNRLGNLSTTARKSVMLLQLEMMSRENFS
jgi:hypothetical protein